MCSYTFTVLILVMKMLMVSAGDREEFSETSPRKLLTAVTEATTPDTQNATTNSAADKWLQKLILKSKEAEIIWNIANRHEILNLSSSEEKCVIRELSVNDELIAPFMVNVTLHSMSNLIIGAHYFDSIYNYSLHRAELHIMDHNFNLMEDEQNYNSTVSIVLTHIGYDSEKNYTCALNSTCGCITKSEMDNYEWNLRYNQNMYRFITHYIMFGEIIDPILKLFSITIGIVLNSALLITFIKEHSVRTEANILIFNLFLNNIITLLIYMPLHHIDKYYHYCRYIGPAFHFVETFIISMNALIVLMLNVQRYFDVSRILRPNVQGCRLSSFARCCIYTSFMWAWSIITAVLIILPDDYDITPNLEIVLFFLMYLFIFSIVIAVFNSLTARKLQSAAKHGQTSSDIDTLTGPSVNLALTLTFYAIHIPFCILLPFDKFGAVRYMPYYYPLHTRIISSLMHLIFSLIPTFNCIVLYKCSSIYRRRFRKFLCRCCFNPEEEQYVTMSSLQNAE